MYRHHPQTARLVELVHGGAIGELRLVRSAFSYSLYDADNIRLRTDVEGGALMDVGCYCVSGSRLLAGEPESVFGSRLHRPDRDGLGVHGLAALSRTTSLGLFDCGTSLPNRDELEAIGTEGSLFLDDPWHCNRPVIELRRDDGVERIEVERGEPVPTRARGPERRDPRSRRAPARARRRGRAGTRDRRALPLGDGRARGRGRVNAAQVGSIEIRLRAPSVPRVNASRGLPPRARTHPTRNWRHR